MELASLSESGSHSDPRSELVPPITAAVGVKLCRRQLRPPYLLNSVSHPVSARASGADGGRADLLALAHSRTELFCGG